MTGSLILQLLLGYKVNMAVWVEHIALFWHCGETVAGDGVYLHESLASRGLSSQPAIERAKGNGRL
jgi:hypothetical protein